MDCSPDRLREFLRRVRPGAAWQLGIHPDFAEVRACFERARALGLIVVYHEQHDDNGSLTFFALEGLADAGRAFLRGEGAMTSGVGGIAATHLPDAWSSTSSET